MVRSDRFWTLYTKYQKHALAEEIAWTASQNPIPGECEGYINCYIYLMTETDGRYLNLYPNGKHQKKAVDTLIEYLGNITKDDTTYDKPFDDAERVDLKKKLVELRKQLGNVKSADRSKAIRIDRQARYDDNQGLELINAY